MISIKYLELNDECLFDYIFLDIGAVRLFVHLNSTYCLHHCCFDMSSAMHEKSASYVHFIFTADERLVDDQFSAP